MLHVVITAENVDELADQLWEVLERIEQFLEFDVEEVIEYDEEGYYYDEVEDELYWVDFTTGEEFFYDAEADEWFPCDEIVEFEEDFVEDEQEVDFE